MTTFPMPPATEAQEATLIFSPVAVGPFPLAEIALGEAVLAVAREWRRVRDGGGTEEALKLVAGEIVRCIKALYDLRPKPAQDLRDNLLHRLQAIMFADDDAEKVPAALRLES